MNPLRTALAAGAFASGHHGLAFAAETGSIPEYSPPWMVLMMFIILALICLFWGLRD